MNKQIIQEPKGSTILEAEGETRPCHLHTKPNCVKLLQLVWEYRVSYQKICSPCKACQYICSVFKKHNIVSWLQILWRWYYASGARPSPLLGLNEHLYQTLDTPLPQELEDVFSRENPREWQQAWPQFRHKLNPEHHKPERPLDLLDPATRLFVVSQPR